MYGSREEGWKNFRGNEYIVCFFSCITAMAEKKKAKAGGGGEMIREAVRKMEKNLVIIIMTFHSRLCLIRLNMAIRDLQNIHLENF